MFCWILALNRGLWFHDRKPPALKVLLLAKCEVPSSSRVIVNPIWMDPHDSGGLLGSRLGRWTVYKRQMGWEWKTFAVYHLEMSSSTGNECFWLNSICMQISAFSNPMGDWWSNRWDFEGGWSISCNGLASVASQEVEFLLIIEAWQHASMIFPEDYVCVCIYIYIHICMCIYIYI